jgi:hypothetical protein
MGKIVRLTENDLTRIVKRVIMEQSEPTSQQKITASAESLLQNSSTSFNKSIGVKNLPTCYDYNSGFGMFSKKEVDWIIDQMDFPVNNDNIRRLFRYLQGSGVPGAFGGSYKNGSIEDRVIKGSDGLFYPAVEQLRVIYNEDESFETLYSAISKKEFSSGNYDSKSYLVSAYQKWIDCVNNTKK